MNTERPRNILIVVPTLNEEAHLAEVVDTLCADWPDDANVSLVVADGGSTDGTRAEFDRLAVGRPTLHWLPNPARIQSAAINLAVRTHGGDAEVLIRADAHNGYPPSFVRRLIETLDRTQADAVVVPMDSVGASCLQRAIAWVSDSPAGSGGSAHRGGHRSGFVDHGHHAAIRMPSFRRAGAYDESFSHNEDAEFDCRQRDWAAASTSTPTSALATAARHARALWRQYAAYGRGRSRTVRKHPGSLRLRQLAVPVNTVLLAAALLLAHWWPLTLAWPALYVSVMALVSVQLALRYRSACALLAGVAGMCMHLAWGTGFFAGLLWVRERPWQPDAVVAS